MSSSPELERFVFSSAGFMLQSRCCFGLVNLNNFITYCLLNMFLGTRCPDNYGSNFQAFKGNRVSQE